MPENKIFSCSNREQWRAWLSEHFESEDEVWFVFPLAGSGEKGVSYNDAVEEALYISVSQFVNKIRNRNLARTYRSTGPTANTQITELIKVFYTI